MTQGQKKPAMKVLEKAQPAEKPIVKGWKPDDDEIALELKDTVAGKLAYFHSAWKVYEGGCWVTRDRSEVRRHVRAELRGWRKRGIKVTQAQVSAVTQMLEDDLFVSDRHIMDVQEEQKQYVNLRNGMFNLQTMEFEPAHRSDLYFTTQLDFDFNEDATCPTFVRYLNSSLVHPGTTQTDGTLITLVKEALAYSMTARTDLKASFWLVGEKDSGKSTFISLIKSLMGNLHTTIDLNQLGTNRFLLAGIAGKRVVTFTEATSSTVLPDALYKTLVGGSDEIYADVKNRDAIAFRPEAKVWWAMNDMPRITDRSGATTRRIIIIPFNRTIPESERVQDLERLLMRERAGIFNEMVNFYRRLQRAGGFERCEQSEQRRKEYIFENDTEATYLDERAQLHESYTVRSSTLYRDYSDWCVERGFKPKNYNQIAGEWRRFGFEAFKSDVMWWKGLKLRDLRQI